MNSIAGYKIALTNNDVQKKYNTDEPAMGYLYSEAIYTSGTKIKMDNAFNYKVECELGVKFKTDIKTVPADNTAFIEMIDYVFPAIEIVAIPKENNNAGLDGFNAANCYFGAAVLGDKTLAPSEIDWELTGMRLELNGLLNITGISAGVLGNPINALKWLAEKLISENSMIKDTDIIISGSFIPAVNACAGDYFRASFLKLGDVAVIFE